jgi:hypothetical protein
MESEITNAETGLEVPLSEPHFDDEATMLSARRVVPLDDVAAYRSQTRSRFGRGWIYATTVAGALLLGAFVGAAYYSYVNRESAQQFVDLENVNGGVEGISTVPAVDNQASTSANASEFDNAMPADSNAAVTKNEEQPPAQQPGVSDESSRSVARRVDVLTFPSSREERLASRRQARERKKQLERESRKSRDDLTRIREIFEGPQKP